jgi:hypothetical protein
MLRKNHPDHEKSWTFGARHCLLHVARRWTSRTVVAMSSADSASSPPLSIAWTGQKWLAGWLVAGAQDVPGARADGPGQVHQALAVLAGSLAS